MKTENENFASRGARALCAYLSSEELRVKRDEGRLAVALAGLAAGVVRLGNYRDSKKIFFTP